MSFDPTAKLEAFLATQQADASRSFYEGVLGLRLVSDNPLALYFDANGMLLQVSKVDSFTAHPFTVLGWIVADIVADVDRLAGRGVVFERYEGFPQDERAICTFGDGDRVAWFKDPDGNVLSLTQNS